MGEERNGVVGTGTSGKSGDELGGAERVSYEVCFDDVRVDLAYFGHCSASL